jgi:hypothetical protein
VKALFAVLLLLFGWGAMIFTFSGCAGIQKPSPAQLAGMAACVARCAAEHLRCPADPGIKRE